jgi:hypothetical protein
MLKTLDSVLNMPIAEMVWACLVVYMLGLMIVDEFNKKFKK